LLQGEGNDLAFDTVENKNVLVDKDKFDGNRYVGQTKNLTTVFDRIEGKYVQIDKELARDKSRYQGPCKGKKNVINKVTGIRSQIQSDDFDESIHINLGDTRYYFKAQNIKTAKIKNIHIFEWHLLNTDDYQVIELDRLTLLSQNYIIKKDLEI